MSAEGLGTAAKVAGSALLGAKGGASAGAWIGTCMCPGAGTIIGAKVGAVAGAAYGAYRGATASDESLGNSARMSKITDPQGKGWQTLGKTLFGTS